MLNFLNGNEGNTVTVTGTSVGEAKLTANIEGFTGPPPEFNVKVTDLKPVKAYIWIVCDNNGNPCVSAPYVTNKVDEANIWLAQKGIDLQIAGINYTNRSDWLTMPSSGVAHDTLRELSHSGDGLKIVFVKGINGARGFNGSDCIGIGLDATDTTLAHEVCHAGGLRDIYAVVRDRNTGAIILDIFDAGVVQAGYMDVKDWGTGYYQNGLLHTNLITRCLMYGTWSPNRGHIPHGSVHGVHRPTPGAALTIGMAPVGLDKLSQQPKHPYKP